MCFGFGRWLNDTPPLAFDRSYNARDVAYLGKCDESIEKIVAELGWEEEFMKLMNETFDEEEITTKLTKLTFESDATHNEQENEEEEETKTIENKKENQYSYNWRNDKLVDLTHTPQSGEEEEDETTKNTEIDNKKSSTITSKL